MRVDGATNFELIHQVRRGWTSAPLPAVPPRLAGIPKPVIAEMRARDGSTVSFLRPTELTPPWPACRWADQRNSG
jgi:hypothetical protein